ncbi:phosphonate metabolism protein/1,5-bisphosphokinase (PRPP-forming) PhnN [Frigidibacter sp. ROC022]|uniref:phosphonate metabolism protein/1,5-bisphosphokinase (PRPP-forming) PhnN n=1 Tax=Frigidibacter sp. ROC022 TaxID=2971796 RepID=UPI00215B6DFE|nr:phosphonate metabolism protein/1,5-bisphosphokinase (PRPP-forming) PhnN [Frigidibacter sp. ROC022]MCR8725030.1 phosphonate metabolism protein/1,5-bisphosphokinase (PRPP-forming) PhnN [Frigidibacter sp. ROC022]
MSLPPPARDRKPQGRLFAVVGPSGVGKDTLMEGARARRPDLHLVRRVITRPETAGGERFEGVTPEAFAARKAAGDFALDWSAHGLRYGIPRAELAPLAAGRDVLFNGSRAALAPARERFPALRVILLTAPPEVLAERLAARGREGRAEIEARLRRASFELPPGIEAREVVNDAEPEQGIARLLAAIGAEPQS